MTKTRKHRLAFIGRESLRGSEIKNMMGRMRSSLQGTDFYGRTVVSLSHRETASRVKT